MIAALFPWAAISFPLLVVVLQLLIKRKVNEIHVMVNSEHTLLVADLKRANDLLAAANESINRLISVLPERTIKLASEI